MFYLPAALLPEFPQSETIKGFLFYSRLTGSFFFHCQQKPVKPFYQMFMWSRRRNRKDQLLVKKATTAASWWPHPGQRSEESSAQSCCSGFKWVLKRFYALLDFLLEVKIWIISKTNKSLCFKDQSEMKDVNLWARLHPLWCFSLRLSCSPSSLQSKPKPSRRLVSKTHMMSLQLLPETNQPALTGKTSDCSDCSGESSVRTSSRFQSELEHQRKREPPQSCRLLQPGRGSAH